jgi:hypothetical protein
MRTLLAMLALLLPVASHAASVSLAYVAGGSDPGQTIILEVRVTANAGEMDNFVYGALNFSDALINPTWQGTSNSRFRGSSSTTWSASPELSSGALPSINSAARV